MQKIEIMPSHAKYRDMFDLSTADLSGRILEYGFGPTAVNANLSGFKHQIIHCDPLFDFPLPFVDFTFDLALSAHYLFNHPVDDDIELHFRVLRELARVAKEVRIYPLEQAGQLSPLVGPVLLELQHDNFGVEVRQVGSGSQSSSNVMLRIWAQQCHVT